MRDIAKFWQEMEESSDSFSGSSRSEDEAEGTRPRYKVRRGAGWLLGGQQLDGDEIVNAPLSCRSVKWRNRKVAMTGLVQLSKLISSSNGNKK